MSAPAAPAPRLATGWRILAWVAGAAAALWLSGFLLPGGSIAGLALRAGAVAAVSLAAWRLLDRRGPAGTPLALDGPGLAGFAAGLLGGLLLVALALAPLAFSGAYRVDPRACRAAGEAAFLGRTFVFFLAAATVEELLFRGYPLFTPRSRSGRTAAVLATAALFAAGHFANPHFGPGALAVLVLVGVTLGLWALDRGSVWPAVGVHVGWNFGLACLATLPVSGLPFEAPCWLGSLAGPAWWTGGGFGLEASVPAAAAWGLAAALLWVRRRRAR